MKRFTLILIGLCICCVGIKSAPADETKPLVVETAYIDYVKAEQDKKAQENKTTKTAQKPPKKQKTYKNEIVAMSALDAVKHAGHLVFLGDYDQATKILTQMPQTDNLPVEIERWYLLAQMEQKKGNLDEAIKIYRKILDDQPDLVKIRYELALCYMAKHQWYRADYHLRLAMAGAD
ncbi:MAG: tetratricopeptide repeat protein, partial [Alphaproteobacteria bacterium]|nr:tetratricopeptide repeat protein [Alphaproteobacteria bacterium]